MMKKPYESPQMGLELYTLWEASNCSGVKVGYMDEVCVLDDKNTQIPPGMRALAGLGYFLGEHCLEGDPPHDDNDGVCIHTAVNMAFTS